MSKLEKLFDIEDAENRQKAIVAYARALRVKILEAKKENGEFSENVLAVLIYDAERMRKSLWLRNTIFAVVGLIVVIVMRIVMLKFRKMIE